jgi:hypothetical protein
MPSFTKTFIYTDSVSMYNFNTCLVFPKCIKLSYNGEVVSVICVCLWNYWSDKLKFNIKNNTNFSNKFNFDSYQLTMNHTSPEVQIIHWFSQKDMDSWLKKVHFLKHTIFVVQVYCMVRRYSNMNTFWEIYLLQIWAHLFYSCTL